MSVLLSVANIKDYDEIISLTSEDKEFYGGMDYLPHALSNWLVEGSVPDSGRNNLIFLLTKRSLVSCQSIFNEIGLHV